MLAVSLFSMVGCSATVTDTKLSCCGNMYIYSDNSFEVSGCKYFHCTRKEGTWTKSHNVYYFKTTNGKTAMGTIDSNGVMTLVF